MSNNPFRPAILFDLDDTLFDYTHSSRAAIATIRQITPAMAMAPEEQIFADYARLLEELHLRVLQGILSIDAARRERFCRLLTAYDPATTPADVERTIDCYRTAYRASRSPVPGAIALLERLRPDATIGIVSNNVLAEQEEKLRFLGLTQYIDTLVVSETVGVSKPDPAIFRTALEQLDCHADNAIMVGDSWEADVCGARAAGISAVWLNRNGRVCPDPTYATTIVALEPMDTVARLLLQNVSRRAA